MKREGGEEGKSYLECSKDSFSASAGGLKWPLRRSGFVDADVVADAHTPNTFG